VSAAAGQILAPKKQKNTKNTHKIKIKSKLNQNSLCDTEAHVGALRPSQATALRPIDAVVVPNTSNTKENEIKPLVTTSKPLSTEATSSESATAQRRRSTSLQELGALPRRSRPTW
jgi:hypothetical protein